MTSRLLLCRRIRRASTDPNDADRPTIRAGLMIQRRAWSSLHQQRTSLDDTDLNTYTTHVPVVRSFNQLQPLFTIFNQKEASTHNSTVTHAGNAFAGLCGEVLQLGKPREAYIRSQRQFCVPSGPTQVFVARDLDL